VGLIRGGLVFYIFYNQMKKREGDGGAPTTVSADLDSALREGDAVFDAERKDLVGGEGNAGKGAVGEDDDDPMADSSTLDFTLAILEEAAEAHQDAIDSVSEFQKLTVEKALGDGDGSFETAYQEVRHVIDTSKQMSTSLRLAAGEASSEVAKDTALAASNKFSKELKTIAQAFEMTAKKYKVIMKRTEMKKLLEGGDGAAEIAAEGTRRSAKDRTAKDKQKEARDAANSLQRVTGLIMESVKTMEAANELLEMDEDEIRGTEHALESYKNEAGTADKTLARIRAKEQRARYELYAAFAFFVFVVLFILIRRLPLWYVLSVLRSIFGRFFPAAGEKGPSSEQDTGLVHTAVPPASHLPGMNAGAAVAAVVQAATDEPRLPSRESIKIMVSHPPGAEPPGRIDGVQVIKKVEQDRREHAGGASAEEVEEEKEGEGAEEKGGVEGNEEEQEGEGTESANPGTAPENSRSEKGTVVEGEGGGESVEGPASRGADEL
jgi:hypothetical protein